MGEQAGVRAFLPRFGSVWRFSGMLSSFELNYKLKNSTIVGIGEIMFDPDHRQSKINVYFQHSHYSKKTTFWSSTFPIKSLRALKTGLYFKSRRPSNQTKQAWVTVQPSKITTHQNVLPMHQDEIISRLQRQHDILKKTPTPQHEHAYFLHENHLRLEKSSYTLIIPCSAVLQFYICTSALITQMAFSPHLAMAISRTIRKEEHLTPTGKVWSYNDKLALQSMASTSDYQTASKTPYKHIMMTIINNHQEKVNNPLTILTKFPVKTETTLLVYYKEFPLGILGHTERRTLVVENIIDSIETDSWERIMTYEFLLKNMARSTTPHIDENH